MLHVRKNGVKNLVYLSGPACSRAGQPADRAEIRDANTTVELR
jgi:hypothetical protein